MLPISPQQIKALFREAMQYQNRNDFDAAENRYRTILESAPKMAEVHFQLGRIAMGRRDYNQALKHLKTARKLKPGEPMIWRQMAEVLVNVADPAKSQSFLKEAKAARVPRALLLKLQDRLSPARPSSKMSAGTAPPQEVQRAIDLAKQNRPKEAEKLARGLSAAHPDVALIAHVLANSLAAQGKFSEAKEHFQRALRLVPGFFEARDAYGRLLIHSGQYDEAIKQFHRVIKEAPGYTPALGNLGRALCEKGDIEAGVIALRHALDRDPNQPEVRLALGSELSSRGTGEEAIEVLNEALRQGDDRAIIYICLGQAYGRMENVDAAMEAFAKAEEKAPNMGRVHAAKAAYLQTLGRFDEAEAAGRKAIEVEPGNGTHYRTLGSSYKMQLEDPLVDQMIERFDDPGTKDGDKIQFGFALSRVMEENKQYDRVFTYLRPACDLMGKHYPYDMAARRKTVDGIMQAFGDTDFSARQVEGATDYAPIFVTGMPRSGTTLVEQILASHSQVTGAGEVGFAVPLISKGLLTPNGEDYRRLESVPDAELASFGAKVAEDLLKRAPDTPRVTDKSIQTFMLMGVIKLAMPNARFVVLRRDPRDNLLSVYKNFFRTGTHTYSYDLEVLGEYYRQFDSIVDFWREKIPGGFHEIQYEEVVANPEEQTRALLKACDLEWEDACLSFHETKRKVTTLSVHQVRQPLYTSSLKGWKRYEKDLAPLIEALGDLAD